MNKSNTQKLALLALLTALVAILAYFGGFIKIGGLASVSLTLIPVVLGACYLGPQAGAILGGVSGIVFFLTPDAAFWMGMSIPGTIITVLVKGILSGLLAGFVFKALQNKNKHLAVLASSVVCPVVNTGIFLLGCLVFFLDNVKTSAAAEKMSIFAFLIIFYVGLNFVFELIANVILSPVVYRVMDLKTKK